MPLNQQVITVNVANEVVGINVKIINIPEDTLRLTLSEHIEKIRKSKDWSDIVGACGLLITSITALASGYDTNSAVPEQVFNFILWVAFLGGIADICHTVRYYPRKPITVEDVMLEINRRVSSCSSSVKAEALKPGAQQMPPRKNNKPKNNKGKGRR